MTQPLPPKSHRLFLLVLVFATVMAALYPLYRSNLRLGSKVRRMERYQPQLEAALRGDKRFSRTAVTNNTGGWVDVQGTVESPAEFDGIVRLVQVSDPPVRVHVMVSAPMALPGQGEAVPVSMESMIGPEDK